MTKAVKRAITRQEKRQRPGTQDDNYQKQVQEYKDLLARFKARIKKGSS
jgi:hypothetical protein